MSNQSAVQVPELAEDVILSVHIPKTGGITLFNLLRKRFGDSLVTDYPDRPGLAGHQGGVVAIHGHFEIADYLSLAPRARILTFLREPLDRALSHYFYWLNPPKQDPQDDPLYIKYFVDQEPEVERFLLAREFCNITTSFLAPLDHPEQFWFVGFQETFAEDVARLQGMLGMPVREQPVLNPGPPRTELNLSAKVIDRFYRLHWRDKAFYQMMFQEFKGRDPYIDQGGGVAGTASSEAELKRLRAMVGQLNRQCRTLEQEQQRILASRSWRLTRPLRALRRRFGGT